MNRRTQVARRVFLLFGVLLLIDGLLFATTTAQEFPVSFTDVARAVGLSDPTIYGDVNKKRYIIETNGCGVAFVDYDNDGLVDLFTLSGTKLTGIPAGREPTNRLYRNKGNGTFADVTDKAGLRRSGWASSVCGQECSLQKQWQR
jgi:hypothetical protein